METGGDRWRQMETGGDRWRQVETGDRFSLVSMVFNSGEMQIGWRDSSDL